MKSINVIRYKTLLMQRLADLVQRGYRFYTHGQVPRDRAAGMAGKFSKIYQIDDNARRRAYKKSKGEGNAFLLLADPDKGGERLLWWLMITPGAHPAHQSEKLLDAESRSQRIRITGYELVRLNKPTGGAGTRWTWRMTDQTYKEWQGAIQAAIRSRKSDLPITTLISNLYATPGFSQCRVQVGKLATMMKGEWKRAGRSTNELVLPEQLHYVRRIPDENYSLADWLKGTQ